MSRVAALVLVLGLLAGCSADGGRLRVGVVDTARVLSQLPEYQSMRMTVSQETSDIFLDTRSEKPPTPEEWKQMRADAEARSKELNERVQTFLEDTVERIRRHSQEVAADRGIDLVVADNPFTRSVQYYDGDDITTDVLLRMEKK